MADKERRINERSLENLKLGAVARRQGKERHNYTILPETHQWLEHSGNASRRLDELVASAKRGEIKSGYTHERIQAEESVSNNAYKEIEVLKVEVERLRSLVAELEVENAKLQAEQQQLPDLEQERDRYLASLKLGKQAPEYKRTKSILDRFIAFISQI